MFDENYAAIHGIKPILTFSKPAYVGFIVPDLSKWLTYDFHYNFIKKNFDAELLFTDTDSLSMKSNQKMSMKNFLSTNTCLILVTIQKIESFLIRPIKKLSAKSKTGLKENMSLLD